MVSTLVVNGEDATFATLTPSTWNSTPVTPTSSVASAVICSVPVSPSASVTGAVNATVGGCESVPLGGAGEGAGAGAGLSPPPQADTAAHRANNRIQPVLRVVPCIMRALPCALARTR
ncbi:MAG: hypothetical protein ACHP83_02305, partial [Burkholderiales bacterium]